MTDGRGTLASTAGAADAGWADSPGVILLNGCTSAGKSSISAQLLRRLPKQFLAIGIDDFLSLLPAHFNEGEQGVFFDPQPDGAMPLRLGPSGRAIARLFHRTVRDACREGFGVVVDDVLFEPWLLDDWRLALDSVPVVQVGVFCPLKELERRERARGDRRIGQARSQIDVVHRNMRYDITVNTGEMGPDRCADEIVKVCAELSR